MALVSFSLLLLTWLLIYSSADPLIKPMAAEDLAFKLLLGHEKKSDLGVYNKLQSFYVHCRNMALPLDDTRSLELLAKKMNQIDEHIWYVEEAYNKSELFDNLGEKSIALANFSNHTKTIHRLISDDRSGESKNSGFRNLYILNILAHMKVCMFL